MGFTYILSQRSHRLILKSRKSWFIIKVLLGITLICLLFKKIGLTAVYESLISIHSPGLYILLGFFLFTVTFILGALCLYILIIPIKKIRMMTLFKYASVSWSLGNIFPLADIASLSYLLKKEGIGWGPGLAINFLNKSLTIVPISIIAILALLRLFTISYATNLTLALVFICLTVLILLSSPGRTIIRKLIHKYSEKFNGFSRILKWYLLRKKTLLLFYTIVSIIRFVVFSSISYVLLTAMGLEIPLFYVILIAAIITIIQAIPSPLRFVGLREAVTFSIAVFFYNQINIPAAPVISAYIIFSLIQYSYAIITLFAIDYKSLIVTKK